MVDIRFEKEKTKRQKLVIEKLENARELQYAYEANIISMQTIGMN
jgi:hypothetical protein